MALVSNHIFQTALMPDPTIFHENDELPENVKERILCDH